MHMLETRLLGVIPTTLLRLSLATLALSLGSRVDAEIIEVTATGTILNGTDYGLFGSPGSLTGQDIVVRIFFDYSFGNVGTAPGVALGATSVSYGWTALDHTSPGIDATITINGVTENVMASGQYPQGYTNVIENPDYSVEALEYGLLSAQCFGPGATFPTCDMESSRYVYTNLQSWDDTSLLSVNGFDPTRPVSYDPSLFDYAGGYFQFGSYLGIDYVNAEFRLSSFTVANSTAVPEPGTWLTILFGFGVMGVALRRKQARVAPPISWDTPEHSEIRLSEVHA